MLPPAWEIEHIFPQRWQSSYFTATPDMNVREIIEHIGNKLPLEKQQNIIASNGYFTVKKQAYQKSQIRMVQDLALSKIVEWRIDDIIESDQRRAEKIMGILQLWESEYEGKRAHAASQPSDEELRQIAAFRANGWI